MTSNGEDITAELREFATNLGLDEVAPGRHSLLLIICMFDGIASGYLNPTKIIREIRALEGIGVPSGTKPPEVFKRAPLKGLLHKHYLADGLRSMAINLRNGIIKDRIPVLDRLAAEVEKTGKPRELTPEDWNAIIHDAVLSNYSRRAAAHELTGEWLIYAEHNGVNYYLCLGRHGQSEEALRNQIDAVCLKEFPFLESILIDR